MTHKILSILSALLAMTLSTSCDDDIDSKYEKSVDLLDFDIVANDNGTLTIETKVSTNVKLAEYCLFDEDYSIVHNFLDNVTAKNDALKETDGAFSVNFAETATDIPVALYIFTILSEDGHRISKTIGEKYIYSHNGGFQVSIPDQMANNKETRPNTIDFSVTDDGLVTHDSNNLLYDSQNRLTDKTDNGVLISPNGVIIAFHSTINNQNIELSCVVIKNVDCSNIKF